MLREVLTATGGDVTELNDWAEAVRDTDDDRAALVAYRARLEYRAITEGEAKAKAAAEARAQEEARVQQNIREKPKRPGPRQDRFIEIDEQVVRVAQELARRSPRTPVKALISEAVRRVNEVLTAFPGHIAHDALICKAVWAREIPEVLIAFPAGGDIGTVRKLESSIRPAATRWSPALGQSEKAVVDRIFGRLRRRPVKGGTISADFGWSYLVGRIQPRRRGVGKIGRPRSKSDED